MAVDCLGVGALVAEMAAVGGPVTGIDVAVTVATVVVATVPGGVEESVGTSDPTALVGADPPLGDGAEMTAEGVGSVASRGSASPQLASKPITLAAPSMVAGRAIITHH